MNILYLGHNNPSTTSCHRAFALRRLGHNVEIQNPRDACTYQFQNRVLSKVHYRTGYIFLQTRIRQWLLSIINKSFVPDLIWVDSGELFGKECIKLLKTLGVPIVLYNVDDPTGKRDGRRFLSLIKALPLYDLVVVVREETEKECIEIGAPKVLRVYRSYDEDGHKPYKNIEEIPNQFRSEVAFIGTWMPNEKRDEFFVELVEKGVPLSIWGDAWQKSPNYIKLKPYLRGKSIFGKDYVSAIQGAKISIGLLSKGNRDLHTQRSLEIPYIGGLFCAERTKEHLALYKEGEEAVFWKDADECAKICMDLLKDDQKREAIRSAGARRIRLNKLGNEDICRHILKNVFSQKSNKTTDNILFQ